MHSVDEERPWTFYAFAAFFGLFVLFLYGPTITIVVLSFQGPSGGLTFPMRGASFHWFGNLFEKQMVGDFAGSFQRSMVLGLATMVVTVLVSFSAGLAFRKRFVGSAIWRTETVTQGPGQRPELAIRADVTVPVVINTVKPRARMRSTKGSTATNSPTLAPCTQTRGPGGRGALGSPRRSVTRSGFSLPRASRRSSRRGASAVPAAVTIR